MSINTYPISKLHEALGLEGPCTLNFNDTVITENDEIWKGGYDPTIHTKEMYARNAKNQIGRKVSKETKKRISESRKGQTLSDETRKKMSDAHKGVKLSASHKQKISEGHNKGKS